MLKIVYPICCGMDVHKSFLIACIASTNSQGVTTYTSKRFSTFTGDLRRCAKWLAEHNCKDVCMESTGKYWIPIYNILEPTCNIVLAHPKYVKAIRGKKTDKKDAKWIADIFKHDLVAGSFIPPADIRQLRDLVRYRWKLTNFTTGEKNRAQNCLTVSNEPILVQKTHTNDNNHSDYRWQDDIAGNPSRKTHLGKGKRYFCTLFAIINLNDFSFKS